MKTLLLLLLCLSPIAAQDEPDPDTALMQQIVRDATAPQLELMQRMVEVMQAQERELKTLRIEVQRGCLAKQAMRGRK